MFGELTKMIRDFVVSDLSQPASERVFCTFFAKCRNPAGHGTKDFLHNVCCIVFGNAALPTPFVNKRAEQ